MANTQRNKMFICRNSRGQNVIEYLLVTAVFVLVCLVFFNPRNSPGKTALENIANDWVDDILRLNNEIIYVPSP